MPKTPAEPTNLVLEQVRLLCAEVKEGFEKVDKRVGAVESEIRGLKREMHGFKLGTIAEIYKANLTVASFVDLESRVSALERKSL